MNATHTIDMAVLSIRLSVLHHTLPVMLPADDAKFRNKSVTDPVIAVILEMKEFVARTIARCARFGKSVHVYLATHNIDRVDLLFYTHTHIVASAASQNHIADKKVSSTISVKMMMMMKMSPV